MKESPILFSTPMVQAIIAGNKTMTRRVVGSANHCLTEADGYYFQSLVRHATGKFTWAPNNKTPVTDDDIIVKKCPFGEVGDKLWVREEHLIRMVNGKIYCGYKDGNNVIKSFDEISPKTLKNLKKRKTIGKWQRGRFLPKDFARIWLEIESISVELLHEITNTDACKEGIESELMEGIYSEFDGGRFYRNYMDAKQRFQLSMPSVSFESLWRKINGAASWERNPWVWVVEFNLIDSESHKPF